MDHERKGYSSVGRAAVSKTAGPGFESWCPCHLKVSRKLYRYSTRITNEY